MREERKEERKRKKRKREEGGREEKRKRNKKKGRRKKEKKRRKIYKKGEDGIRERTVTGEKKCALAISNNPPRRNFNGFVIFRGLALRSAERRVGQLC